MIRPFDPDKDRAASRRIWQEVGWVSQDKEDVVDAWVDAGRTLVSELNGEAECMVCTAPGTFTVQDKSLPASLVTGVTTSRVARKQGLALKTTAITIAEDVEAGAVMACLGIFDQGFYNKLGFGTGAYEHEVTFDPQLINVPGSHRPPQRITVADAEAVHRARLNRPVRHGQCTLYPPAATWAHMREGDNTFGLGYRDAHTGEFTHHFWCCAKGERGPYRIDWMVFHTAEQFRELLSVIRSLGDQVRAVRMREPAGILIQDIMEQPFKQAQISAKGDYAAGIFSRAAFQHRICDLQACVSAISLPGTHLKFNLELSDPIEKYLQGREGWNGVTGSYTVSLGETCSATPGATAGLPVLRTSVGPFTRLWLGVRPATGLAMTEPLDVDQSLLHALDAAIKLPTPVNDWDY